MLDNSIPPIGKRKKEVVLSNLIVPRDDQNFTFCKIQRGGVIIIFFFFFLFNIRKPNALTYYF